jgi:hypothetical protein
MKTTVCASCGLRHEQRPWRHLVWPVVTMAINAGFGWEMGHWIAKLVLR